MTNIKQFVTKYNIVFVFSFLCCCCFCFCFFSFSFIFILIFVVVVVDILLYFSSVFNYTFYKNPGFWFVNSRCIFRVISYLGLISFMFTAAGVFAWGFYFLSPLCRGTCEHLFHFFTLPCLKPPNSFGIGLLYLYA